jgi:hypothetical protein
MTKADPLRRRDRAVRRSPMPEIRKRIGSGLSMTFFGWSKAVMRNFVAGTTKFRTCLIQNINFHDEAGGCFPAAVCEGRLASILVARRSV